MTKRVQRKFPRLRRIFRWCRIFILLAVLGAIVAGIYLNTIGLPDFLKRPLLAKLRKEGVQLDFSRMRLRWYRGIVVDKATFTFLKQPLEPKFSAAETELDLDIPSLRNSRLKFNSIAIKQGHFLWPVSKTNQTALSLNNITTRIKFPSAKEIALDFFQADFSNTRIKISGSITNVAALRDWKMFQPKIGAPKGGLERIAATLEKIHLHGSPELTFRLVGDAADPRSFRGHLNIIAPEADTPWGHAKKLQLSADLRDVSHGNEDNFVRLKIDSAETRWGSASNLNCVAKLSPGSTNSDIFQTDIEIFVKQLSLEAGHASSIHLAARTALSFTNFIPSHISGNASLVDVETEWGKANSADIKFSVATNSASKIADKSWAAWGRAEPFLLDWEGCFAGIETPKLKIEKVLCAGTWCAPELQLSSFEAELYGGGLVTTGRLNIATREANVKGSSDFDVQKISPLLTPFGQRWIAKYTWEKPPALGGDLHVTLPAWTNRSPNWRQEVLPTLALNGHVSVGRGTYRDVTATSASTDFAYSNMVWTLPHLRVGRPEGGADVNLVANDRTGEYRWRVHSQIDPRAIRHLLTEQQQRVFDDFGFTTPPTIRAEIVGRWNDMEKSSVDAEISANKFFFRSNSIDKLTCSLQVADQSLRVSEGRLERAGKLITAQKIQLDFPTRKLFFTNVYSTDDPYLVARLIGRKVAAHLAPYQFAESPTIRLNGSLNIGRTEEADLHFFVEGTKFHWTHFDLDKISGQIDWVGETLLLTNVNSSAYRGGRIAGWSYFDFAPTNGTDFRFDLAAADIDLQSAFSGIKGKTNHLEGLLHGQLAIESGNLRDPKTCRGHGRVNLRDGLIWDVPIFGIFSPMLNALMPGAGNSRAREGSANFLVREGIIYSDDLEIRSAGVRLQYRGGIDFEQRVDARVEAEMLRDTWVIGPIVSLALKPISKIFEYKVTGTLSQPETEPVYIPNFLMMTLHPFHSLKEALTPEKVEAETTPTPSAEKKP
ncbi:MAG: hypothetical protein ABIR24_04365 [Verrucomicrobiota bacterium]